MRARAGQAPAGVSDEARASVVAAAALVCSLADITARVPDMPSMFLNYLGIYFGLVPALAFVAAELRRARLRPAELGVLAALAVLLPLALVMGQGAMDAVGNTLRVVFVLVAVAFWRLDRIALPQLLRALYTKLWVVVLVVSAVKLGLEATGTIRAVPQHMPELIFLFAYALGKRRWAELALLAGLVAVSQKEGLYVALLAMLAAFFLIRHRWWIALLLVGYAAGQTLLAASPAILILDQMGGNFARLGAFLASFTPGDYDADLINAISSNRYLEYRSIMNDWRTGGVPYLGRGLGATVAVELGWEGTFVERSTLHNSFVTVFHILGLPGLLFLWVYFLRPALQIRRHSLELFLAQVGILSYALFSNTLLTDPTMVLVSAAAFGYLRQTARPRPGAAALRVRAA